LSDVKILTISIIGELKFTQKYISVTCQQNFIANSYIGQM